MRADSDAIPPEILEAYDLELQTFERAPSGLINQTWIVETRSAERYVVQQLHALIPPAVNERIQIVTARLRQLSICTPLLVPTTNGDTYVGVSDGVSWRVLTYVQGTSFDTVPDANHAREAGRVLARFHAAGVDWAMLGALPLSTAHDLPHHLDALCAALKSESLHNDYANIAKLADEILSFARTLTTPVPNSPRLVHGDPKISNILFGANGGAVCLVDLDTVGLMDLVWELGDAFRSWCNRSGEDTASTEFSLEIFEHALSGYAEFGHHFIRSQEVAGIVCGILTIYVELAARFCADALLEHYFAWDPTQFSTRSAHNLTRARGQFNAAKDLASKRADAERIVERVFGSGVS